MKTTTTARLTRFRTGLYHEVLGMRRDAQFELLDAVLTGDGPRSLVGHSLASCFRRGWSSPSDALADGSLDTAALRRQCVRGVPTPAKGGRLVWAIDGSSWPRPAAKTVAARTFCRVVTRGQPAEAMVGGWEYQWLAAIPEAHGSWALPLDVTRRGPTDGTPTTLAIVQLGAVLGARRRDAPRPVIALDSHYDLVALIAAALPCDLLVRLASRRTVYGPPPPYAGTGAPRKHGAVFKTHDPTTWRPPDRVARRADPTRGWVQVDVWEELHRQSAAIRTFAVVRVTVGRLPRREAPPAPLWLAFHGALPDDLLELWRWYERRFAIEHLFRFLKQEVGWTSVRVGSPAAADRWSWLLAAGIWQLWLARTDAREARLPWQPQITPTARPPGRVRRGFAALLLACGTPARPPTVRGKSPGRRHGERPGRRPRHPVHHRGANPSN